jgi:DNA-binding transcriptional MerR regulator
VRWVVRKRRIEGIAEGMAESELPLYSIGAVSRMLDLSAATIRTWETRYGKVSPARSEGGQRLYSRDQVEHLRFVKEAIAAGRRPAEAHRLLAERIARGESFGGTPKRVLLAESRIGAAAVLRELLDAEGFEVLLAPDPATARRVFEEHAPALVLIDTGDEQFSDLSHRLRSTGTKVLPAHLLQRPLALVDEARSMLAG